MRVVSLACSNTEIVCALGCGAMLVGVDDHSDHPPEVVESLPRVGPDLEVDIERVAALRPDLVLASLTVPGHERNVERLRAAGLPFLAPEPTCLEHVLGDIREIAARLGVPEAGQDLARRLEQELRPTPPGPRRPSVLVEWWPGPVIVPGRRSWVTDLLRLAGGVNPLEEDDVTSRPLEPGEVERLDPDALVISWCGVGPERYRPDVVARREGWGALRAVREGRIYCVPEAFLGRPGPRLVEGLRALRGIVAELRG